MRSHSYLNSAKKILESYDGGMPLAAWLKDFFKANKKFGSKDRKEVSHLCYCFYRLGGAFKHLEQEERMLLAVFLCSDSANLVLQELKPEWNEKVDVTVEQKLKMVGGFEDATQLFPLIPFLSSQIDAAAFSISHLNQPSLFLRIRPGAEKVVTKKLSDAGIVFDKKENSVRLQNGTKIENILSIDKEAVIQDLNSQKTLESLVEKTSGMISEKNVWDCCAASGGKSILYHDLQPSSFITVSDVRESILANLRKRFAVAGINSYEGFTADLSLPRFSLNQKFDIIICDAPCSGSGTWGRTPEQMQFFKEEKINEYASLQKKISVNAAKQLKQSGFFLYITCSVFAAENEQVVKYIVGNTSLQLINQQYLKGYDQRADTLFTALFSL